ncbi:MAG: tRNA dihydrouridine synthase DusB [Bacteroidetes bacterium]|nr:tRNA dihydrouridine synthase DusB [Bacteroidota bacterium]
MKVGNIDLGEKLFVAPMADVSDHPFRIIAKEFGAGLTFTQMVSARGVIENDFGTLRRLVFSRNEQPVGVQILGNNPVILKNAVKELVKYSPDLIDLNCGCPVSKVTKHDMGASLLDDPKLIGKLVKSMVEGANGVPISIKIRLGKDKKNINVLDNAKAAEDNGASLIIVHARTKIDRYSENPDWEWLKKVKDNISIPVIGNGSVFEPEDIVKMKIDTGCDSVMVARGALGNPFLFERYNSIVEKGFDPGEPDIIKVRDTAIRHIKLLVRDFGENNALDRIKKNVVWYFRKYNGINNFLDNIFSFKDSASVINFIYEHSEKIINNYFPEEDLINVHKKFENKVLFWLAEEKEFELINKSFE